MNFSRGLIGSEFCFGNTVLAVVRAERPKQESAYESPAALVKNADSDSVSVGWGLRNFVSHKLPGETRTAGVRTILGGTRVEGVDGGGGKTSDEPTRQGSCSSSGGEAGRMDEGSDREMRKRRDGRHVSRVISAVERSQRGRGLHIQVLSAGSPFAFRRSQGLHICLFTNWLTNHMYSKDSMRRLNWQ